jgi:hypothetical protein
MTGTNDTLRTTDNSGKSFTWLQETVVFGLLVGSGVTLRLTCHDLPNFAPVAAIALFAGYFFRSTLLAACVPLTVMALSDLRLGGYHAGVMALVYGMLMFPVCLRGLLHRAFAMERGRWVESLAPLAGLISCALASSVLFFLVTNFGVWLGFNTYDRTWSGLMECYVAAIPFFRYTLAGDMFFAIVLFGSYALAINLVPARTTVPASR